MAKLGKASEEALASCTPDMQRLVRAVVQRLPTPYDLTVVCGHRGEAAQEEAFRAGKSTKHWPDSNHNALPSKAVDIALFPIDWNDRLQFGWLAGFVFAVASELGLSNRLRWGGDWDRDGKFREESFADLPHFELRD